MLKPILKKQKSTSQEPDDVEPVYLNSDEELRDPTGALSKSQSTQPISEDAHAFPRNDLDVNEFHEPQETQRHDEKKSDVEDKTNSDDEDEGDEEEKRFIADWTKSQEAPMPYFPSVNLGSHSQSIAATFPSTLEVKMDVSQKEENASYHDIANNEVDDATIKDSENASLRPQNKEVSSSLKLHFTQTLTQLKPQNDDEEEAPEQDGGSKVGSMVAATNEDENKKEEQEGPSFPVLSPPCSPRSYTAASFYSPPQSPPSSSKLKRGSPGSSEVGHGLGIRLQFPQLSESQIGLPNFAVSPSEADKNEDRSFEITTDVDSKKESEKADDTKEDTASFTFVSPSIVNKKKGKKETNELAKEAENKVEEHEENRVEKVDLEQEKEKDSKSSNKNQPSPPKSKKEATYSRKRKQSVEAPQEVVDLVKSLDDEEASEGDVLNSFRSKKDEKKQEKGEKDKEGAKGQGEVQEDKEFAEEPGWTKVNKSKKRNRKETQLPSKEPPKRKYVRKQAKEEKLEDVEQVEESPNKAKEKEDEDKDVEVEKNKKKVSKSKKVEKKKEKSQESSRKRKRQEEEEQLAKEDSKTKRWRRQAAKKKNKEEVPEKIEEPAESEEESDNEDESEEKEEVVPEPPKKKTKKAKTSEKENMETESKKEPSSSPKKKTKQAKGQPIFKGMYMLVTGLKVNVKDDEESLNDEIRQLITSHGGAVIDEVNWRQPISCIKRTHVGSMPSTILIADKERRTMKYFLALAAGVPCVHYNWIKECVEQQKLVNYDEHVLPSGYSDIEKKKLYCKEPPFSDYIFEGLRIEVIGNIESFKLPWTAILKEGGAKVVERLFSSAETRLDVVVADKDVTQVIMERTHQLKIPLVSPEWIIQSLFKRKTCKYNASPKFKFNYDEGDPTPEKSPKKAKAKH